MRPPIFERIVPAFRVDECSTSFDDTWNCREHHQELKLEVRRSTDTRLEMLFPWWGRNRWDTTWASDAPEPLFAYGADGADSIKSWIEGIHDLIPLMDTAWTSDLPALQIECWRVDDEDDDSHDDWFEADLQLLTEENDDGVEIYSWLSICAGQRTLVIDRDGAINLWAALKEADDAITRAIEIQKLLRGFENAMLDAAFPVASETVEVT